MASSDAEKDPLSYYWDWEIGNQAYGAQGPAPWVQLPPGIHEITLVVSDGILDSVPDTVIVTVLNTAPIANAGADITSYLGFDGDWAACDT